MKILLLIDNFGSGGAQRQMISIAEAFKAKGMDVSFLIYDNNNFHREKVDKLGLAVHCCASGNVISRMFRVRRYIRKGKFDAVISFMDTPNFLNNFSAIGGHKWKVVTSERSYNEAIFRNRKNRIFNLFSRFSDAIVCNSERARRMWLGHMPDYESKLHVVYNTVLLPEMESQYIPLENGKVHIVIAASFQSLKNPINFVKGLALLSKDELSHLKIDWYGARKVSGEGTTVFDTAEEMVIGNHMEDTVSLHDATSDISSLMEKADCVALFSKYEGMPNAICEGMWLGKPIIMTKVSDYDVLIDSDNGFLCDWDKPDTIASALRSIINCDKERLLAMGKASERKARNLFDREKIISEWMNIIGR